MKQFHWFVIHISSYEHHFFMHSNGIHLRFLLLLSPFLFPFRSSFLWPEVTTSLGTIKILPSLLHWRAYWFGLTGLHHLLTYWKNHDKGHEASVSLMALLNWTYSLLTVSFFTCKLCTSSSTFKIMSSLCLPQFWAVTLFFPLHLIPQISDTCKSIK